MTHIAVAFVFLAASLAGCAHREAGGPPLLSSNGQSSDSEQSSNSSDQSSNSSEQNEASSESSKSDENSLERSSENSTRDSAKASSDETSSQGEGANNNGPVLTTAGVLLTGTAVGVVVWMRNAGAPPQQQRIAAQTTRQWLVANRHQLALDLGLGAGPALEDLAGAAGIAPKNIRLFGRVLRQHRRELLAISQTGQLDGERALDFLQRVGELSRREPRLAADYRRFVDGWKKTQSQKS